MAYAHILSTFPRRQHDALEQHVWKLAEGNNVSEQVGGGNRQRRAGLLNIECAIGTQALRSNRRGTCSVVGRGCLIPICVRTLVTTMHRFIATLTIHCSIMPAKYRQVMPIEHRRVSRGQRVAGVQPVGACQGKGWRPGNFSQAGEVGEDNRDKKARTVAHRSK